MRLCVFYLLIFINYVLYKTSFVLMLKDALILFLFSAGN